MCRYIIYHDTNKALTMPTWHCQGLRVAMSGFLIPARKCLFTLHLLLLSFCVYGALTSLIFSFPPTLQLLFCLFELGLALQCSCLCIFPISISIVTSEFSPVCISSPWFPFFISLSFFLIFVFRFRLGSTCTMVFQARRSDLFVYYHEFVVLYTNLFDFSGQKVRPFCIL